MVQSLASDGVATKVSLNYVVATQCKPHLEELSTERDCIHHNNTADTTHHHQLQNAVQ